ncbi:hypothetical protein DFH06DRAFT_984794 [Mycena polygramma]|nr:hypothetical protein DFH06DRAFT_984794 [Mycena polygramma]
MATKFLYSDGTGVIPEPHIGSFDGTTWVALNCTLELLPPHAMRHIDAVTLHSSTAAINDDGTFTEMEWSSLPLWHHHERDYRAWMPVSRSPHPDDPWFMQTAQTGLFESTASDPYVLIESQRARIVADIQRAAAAVQDIVTRPPFSALHPRPPLFDVEALYKGRGSERDARALVTAARRNMLEHLGFLSWRKSTCSQWARDVKKETINAVEEFGIDRYEKRGVLIHLARDWKEISLQTLLKNEVPVLYPWTVREEVDARFACLSPSILSAFKEKCAAAGGPSRVHFPPSVADSATFKKLCSYSLYMDDPSTDYTPPQKAPTTIPKQASVRIIDFPGWGSRDVATQKLKNRYLKLYHFGTFGKVVVFWRHRPRAPEASKSNNLDDSDEDVEDDESEREDDAVDSTEELLFVREQYKGSCTPRPGQTFDPETGFQKDKSYMGMTALERFAADLDRALPPASSPAFRAAREAVEENPSSQPALLKRLSAPGGFPPPALQPPSLMARMSKPPPTGPRTDRRQVNSRSQSRSSTSQRRSASPPRRRSELPPRPSSPEGGFRKPSASQAAELNAWLQGSPKLAHEYTWVSMPESFKWDTKFLDHAYLLLDSPGAEVRLRYLASATGAETAVEVLDLALTRCIPFRLAVRESALDNFRERNLSSAERSIAAAYFPVGSGEAALEYGRGGAEFANEYNRRFLDLLRRPHMRRMASMGGVFAWLAWRAEMGHVDNFLKGPSIQVTQFGRGWNDGHKDYPLHVTCDELSYRDQETLLGHVRDGQTDRWVWPTEALLLELCAHYSGEMNPEVDHHLGIIYSEIRGGEAQARSHSGWEKFFRRGNRGANAPSTPKITKSELRAEDARMRSLFTDSWAAVKVRDMFIPGIIRSV